MSAVVVSPALAAALEARCTDWLVIPSTTECPDCAVDRLVREQCPTCTWGVVLGIEDEMPCPDCGGVCFVEVPGVVPAHLTGDCPTCDGSGRVPWVVEMGDTLTVRIIDELPERPKRFGGWELMISPDDGDPALVTWRDHSQPIRSIPLRPGGSLSVTVAAVLPIVEHLELDSDGDTFDHIGSVSDGRFWSMIGHTLGDLSADQAWQDFTPGMQAIQVGGVEVVPS